MTQLEKKLWAGRGGTQKQIIVILDPPQMLVLVPQELLSCSEMKTREQLVSCPPSVSLSLPIEDGPSLSWLPEFCQTIKNQRAADVCKIYFTRINGIAGMLANPVRNFSLRVPYSNVSLS